MVLSIFIKICHKLIIAVATLIFLIFLITQVPILTCVLFCRSLVWLLAKCLRPDLQGFVTKENASFAVYPTTRPHKSINIVTSGSVNGQLTALTIRRLLQDRILNQTNDKNEFVYLRLRQTWTSFLGYAFWKTDQNFSLGKHVREYDYKGDLALPSPCKESDISELLGRLTETPWRKNQSPWEVLIINNYIHGESPGPKTYLIFKIDHVLCDGYSIQSLLKQLFETKFSVPNIELNRRSFSFLEKLGLILRGPFDLVENILTVLLSKRIYNVELSKQVISSVSPVVPVSLIKDIKNHYKVSYAAVLQSAVQGALVRAMISAKMAVPKNLCCSFVLPIPNHPGGMVIHAQLVATQLPCQADSCVDRLYKTQRALQELSSTTAGLGLVVVARVGACYPIIVRRVFLNVMSSIGISYAISHFPVTTSSDYFEGLELMEMVANLGTYRSLGIMIATGGTNNKQRFTFNVDKNVFGSEEIASNLGPSVLKELQDLAGGLA